MSEQTLKEKVIKTYLEKGKIIAIKLLKAELDINLRDAKNIMDGYIYKEINKIHPTLIEDIIRCYHENFIKDGVLTEKFYSDKIL